MEGLTYTFENGVLYAADRYGCSSVKWGKRPVACERLAEGEWKEGNPFKRFLVPARIDAGENREALDSFARLVPRDIRRLVMPFAGHQWMMMRLLALNPYSFDLANSNPVLAFCLANADQFKNIYREEICWEQANLYSRRKQKLILQWLGFPATGIVVKFFKKIDADEMSIGLMRLLRTALQTENPALRLLSHCNVITPGMMGLLKTGIAKYITSELVADAAGNTREHDIRSTADKLTEVCLMERCLPGKIEVPVFRSVASVMEYHARMELEYRAKVEQMRRLQKKLETSLGDPPLEGTDYIVPITTKAELRLEGKDMKNCVASYINKVKRGEMYLYRVLYPERATLSIAPAWSGAWAKKELKLKCNKACSAATHKIVEDWICRHNEEQRD